MAPDYGNLRLAKEYNDAPKFGTAGPETSYSSDYKWKMNTDFLKSSVARRLPNGHNPHPRDARYISWFTDTVCNMSTYDRPLTGYTHYPRSRRELMTTSSLSYQAPPPESYRARTAGASDRAVLLASTGVKCALSTYSQPTRSFSADQSYRLKTGRTVDLQVDKEKREKLLRRASRQAYKPKIEERGMTKDEVVKLKIERLERERSAEQSRYRASVRKQMENSKYDFSLIPFVHRNTEVCHPQARRMINKRIAATVPGLVK